MVMLLLMLDKLCT